MLTPAQESMLSWARRIVSFDEVPEVYKDFFKTLPDNGDEFPYTVLTPSYRVGFLRRTNPKLVCSSEEKIYVLERRGDELACTCYPLEDISCVEVGSILLKSWIKIRGVTSDGALTSTWFECSLVTTRLFDPLVRKVRGAANNFEDKDRHQELAKFNYLANLNFKFMNYARQSIMPGEKVIDTLLQPEIHVQVFRLLGRSFVRITCPAHISVLTDQELIIIRDEEDGLAWREGIRYGGIWDYIPLKKIMRISLAEREDDTLCLSIHLPQDDHIDCLFSTSNRHAVELFLSHLEASAYGQRPIIR
jgi:hypothetical protein